MPYQVTYLHLVPGAPLPDLPLGANYKAVVMIEDSVQREWQRSVSQWLVRTGCLYMMAWGLDCSSWDDSVDYANIEDCNYDDIPEETFVLTTWHEDETLDDVLGFAKIAANHSHVELASTLLVHIARAECEKATLEAFHNAWEV